MHFSCKHLLIPLCFFALQLAGQNDSLKGFDRATIIREGILEGHNGGALRTYVSMQQQKFIDLKYGLQQRPTGGGSPPGLGPYGCDGSDFENDAATSISFSTQLQGWLYTEGYNGYVSGMGTNSLQPFYPNGVTNPNTCSLPSCCPLPPQRGGSVINTMNGGFIEPSIGAHYPIFSVFGTDTLNSAAAAVANPQFIGRMKGNRVLRINDFSTGDYGIGRITKTFFIDTSNCVFRYAFISVFQQGHACCDGAAVHFNFRSVPGGSLIPAISTSITPYSSVCPSANSPAYYYCLSGSPIIPNYSPFSGIYNRWEHRLLDLSPYIGQTISFEVIASDCNAGGHFGVVYFDSQCAGKEVLRDGSSSGTLCATAVTVSTPTIISNWMWYGPNSFTTTAATFTAASSGIYTLQSGLYTRTISVILRPAPVICPPSSTVCPGQSYVFKASGLMNYVWNNGTMDSINVVLMDSNRVITVGGLDSMSCYVSNSATFSLVYKSIGMSASKNPVCAGEQLILSGSSGLAYSWSTGASGHTIAVQPSVPTTYTVYGYHANTCTYSKTITINVLLCSGLESETVHSFTIFPNPTRHQLTLCTEAIAEKRYLNICNSLGQEVLRQEVTSTSYTIALPNLSPGLYFVELKTAQGFVGREKLLIE